MAKSIGSAAVEAATRERMTRCGTEMLDEYIARLEHDAAERHALVEEIVVSETWFFRDPEVFRDLGTFAIGAWRRAHPEGTLRVLCVPCATGEEPYSAAITLLEAGLPENRFMVQGVDVSNKALERARVAVYGKHAFRSAESPAHASYFEKVSGGQRVIERVKGSVTLIQGNVLDRFLVSPSVRFDVIFCRNLLIYLDGAARTRALDNLCQWLAPGGIFFAGHAEALESMDTRFARLGGAGHCTYVQRQAPVGAHPAAPRIAKLLVGLSAPVASFPISGKPAKAPAPQQRRTAARAQPTVAAAPVQVESSTAAGTSRAAALAAVTEMANRGEPSAAAACEQHITEWGPSADAYGLLGMIRNAAGTEQAAIEAFNRALYLEPSHHSSLIHLALLHERRGDRAIAANFRRRAERALPKESAR